MSRATTLMRRAEPARPHAVADADDPLEAQANSVARDLTGGRGAASLDDVVRSVGAGLGADLSGVRLHQGVDHRTAAAGRDAVTRGHDVFLSSAVDPSTPEGHFLVAHELAHVVQQTGGGARGAVDAAPVAPQGGLLDWFKKSKPSQPKSPGTYKDKHLAKGTKAQSLGGNTANEVYKTEYEQKHTTGSTTGYFKEDGDQTVSKYAVGASSLARGMGLGGLIPDTFHAEHTIKDGSGKKRKAKGAMSLAGAGSSLGENVFDDVTDRIGGAPSEQEFKDTLEPAGYKMRDGRVFAPGGNEVADVDLSDPRVQKQLNQLQWFDALIGNQDRHSGNILFDPDTGTVTGIDNDLSFGNGVQAKDTDGSTDAFTGGFNAKYLGLPSMIDDETAQMFLGLTPEQIEAMLNPKGTKGSQRFTDEELQQTYERLAEIQRVVQGKVDDGDLVGEWDRSTYDRSVNETMKKSVEGDIARSYVQRHHKKLEKAKDTNVPDVWRTGKRQEDTTPAPVPVQQPAPQPAPIQQPAPQPVQTAPQLPPRPTRPAPLPPTSMPPLPSPPRPTRPAPSPPGRAPRPLPTPPPRRPRELVH